MTVLANSLKRIWAATSRVPHLTGWGTCGTVQSSTPRITLAGSIYESVLALVELGRHNAPTVVIIALNIFR